MPEVLRGVREGPQGVSEGVAGYLKGYGRGVRGSQGGLKGEGGVPLPSTHTRFRVPARVKEVQLFRVPVPPAGGTRGIFVNLSLCLVLFWDGVVDC